MNGGVDVIIDRFLPKHDVRVGPDGKVHAGSMEAVERLVANVNRAGWVILGTSPPCAWNRETNELVDLPEPAEPPPPSRCRRCGVRHA